MYSTVPSVVMNSPVEISRSASPVKGFAEVYGRQEVVLALREHVVAHAATPE